MCDLFSLALFMVLTVVFVVVVAHAAMGVVYGMLAIIQWFVDLISEAI